MSAYGPLPRRAFVAAAGAGLASAALPRGAHAQTVPLKVAAPFSDLFGEPYYAKDAGTFARAGYDLDVTTIFAGSAVVAAVASGSVELGVADLISSAQAFLRGVPIQLLAPCALYVSSEPPQNFLVVAHDSPVRRPRDLEGRTIGVPQIAGGTLVSLRAWFAATGVDGTKVRLVEIPNTIAGSAIVRGTVDAGTIAEPFYTPIKDQLRVIGRPLDAIGKTFVNTAWFATRGWIDADRDRAKRVAGAIFETARWANAHRPETLQILVRDAKLDFDRVRTMARITFATALVLSQVEPVLAAAARYGAIDRPVAASAFAAQL